MPLHILRLKPFRHHQAAEHTADHRCRHLLLPALVPAQLLFPLCFQKHNPDGCMIVLKQMNQLFPDRRRQIGGIPDKGCFFRRYSFALSLAAFTTAPCSSFGEICISLRRTSRETTGSVPQCSCIQVSFPVPGIPERRITSPQVSSYSSNSGRLILPVRYACSV